MELVGLLGEENGGRLKAFLHFALIPGDLEIHPPNILTVKTGGNTSSGILLPQLLEIGQAFIDLRSCTGFEEAVKGFTNPTQILDTLFEFKAAHYCFKLPQTQGLEFSPAVTVKRQKFPDFKFWGPFGTFTCECKSMHPSQHDYQKRINFIAKEMSQAIEAAKVPEQMRVDVHLEKGIVSGDLKKQLSSLVEPFQFRVASRGLDPAFSKYTWAQMSIKVQTTSTPIHWKSANFRFTVNTLRKHRGVSKLIKDARTQLPGSEKCLIFLEVYDQESAQEDALKFIENPHYTNVLAIFTWGNDLKAHYLTANADVLSIFKLVILS